MDNVHINKAALDSVVQDLGAKIAEIVNDTANETADQPIEDAIALLHTRLNQLPAGAYFPHDWCRNALETLRRGDPLELTFG